MTELFGSQLSLIAQVADDDRPIADWGYEKLGTKEISVPNLPTQKLGTKEISVPNLPTQKLGTEEILVPNLPTQKLGTEEILVPNFCEPPTQIRRWDEPKGLNWKPPIGCLDRKPIKNHQYWCWRYYDNAGTKRSIHLGKDYNKAVSKAMKIGMPPDAKLPKHIDTETDLKTPPDSQ